MNRKKLPNCPECGSELEGTDSFEGSVAKLACFNLECRFWGIERCEKKFYTGED